MTEAERKREEERKRKAAAEKAKAAAAKLKGMSGRAVSAINGREAFIESQTGG